MKTRIFYILISLFLTNMVSHGQATEALQADPANDYYKRIHNLYKDASAEKDPGRKAKSLRRCIPMFLRYIRNYPNHAKAAAAYYYLGESYYHLGDVRLARQTFVALEKKFKGGTFVAAATYRLAHDSYTRGDYLIAAKYFGITVKNSNDEKDKLKSTYFQAQCLLKGNKEAQALPLYKKVYQSTIPTPYRQTAKLTYGKLLLKNESYAQSLMVFESLLVPNQAEKIKAEAAYYSGVSANGLGQIDRAEKFYKICLLANDEQWKGPAQTGLLGIRFARKDYKGVIQVARRGSYKMTAVFKAKQGFIVGHSYFKLKDYAGAITYFLDVEKHDKGSEAAFKAGYYKLLCFYNIDNDGIGDRVDHFLQNYAIGRGKHKFIHQAILMKAETQYRLKKYQLAAASYTAINPKLIDEKYRSGLLFRKACSRLKLENFAGAVDVFTSLIKTHPKAVNIVESHLLRASAYVKLGDSVRALRDYDKVIELTPKSKSAARALQQSALLQNINKKTDDMILRYEKLIKDFPTQPKKTIANAYYWVGRGYFKKKQYALGIKNLDDCRKLDPLAFSKQIAMLKLIGNFTLREVEQTSQALVAAEKEGLKKKIPLNVYRWLGGESYNNEDFKKAAEYLKKGIEHGKPSETPIAVWRVLTKAQMRAELYKDAFFTVSTLLSLEEEKPRIVDALLDKAKIQLKLGKSGDAKRSAEAALEMNPVGKVQAELLNVLGHFYYITSQHEEAAKRYVLLVDSAKELEFHALAIDRLAACLRKLGDEDEAKLYEKLLKKQYPKYKREKL